MRKWHRIGALIGGLLLLLPVLAACGGGTSSTPSGQTPKKGGTVVNGLYEEPDTLLPFLTNETYAVMVDQALWAPLWYGDPGGNLIPGLATAVPSNSNGGTSSDLKTWTFHLKSGLKWSDGTPLTADDCAYSYNLYGNPDFANTFGFPTTDPTDPTGFVGATAVDSTTVKVVFRNSLVNFNALAADGASSCMSKAHYGSIKPADFAKSPENTTPQVVSGPFKVKERVQGDHITLVPNPNYYQTGKPYLNQMIFKIIPDQSTILTALQAGSIDSSWFLDVTKYQSYQAIQGYKTGVDTSPAGFEWAFFHLTNPILADVNVRKALSISFDRSQIVSQIYNGTAQLICDDHGGTWAHEPNLQCYKYDQAAANQLLDTAGWTDRSPAGCTLGQGDCYRAKGGKTLELRYTTTNKTSRHQTQLLAQADWKKIGVKINIISLPANDFFGSTGALAKGDFDIGEFHSGGGYDPDDSSLFLSSSPPVNNPMRYSNPQVDQLEKDQLSSGDQAKRLNDFKQIHQIILQDVPGFYLFGAGNIFCWNQRLKNYNPSPQGGSETWNIWDWWVTNA